jgi:hypothetical protein
MVSIFKNGQVVEVHNRQELEAAAAEIKAAEHVGPRFVTTLDNDSLWTVADTHTGGLQGSFNDQGSAAGLCGILNQVDTNARAPRPRLYLLD